MTYIIDESALLDGLKKESIKCRECGHEVSLVDGELVKHPLDWIAEFAEHCDLNHGTKMRKKVEELRRLSPERQVAFFVTIFDINLSRDWNEAIRRGLITKVRHG